MERGTWNDQKLDDFAERVDLRFEQIDQRFDGLQNQMRDGFVRVDRELLQIRGEIAGINSTLHQLGGRIMVGLMGLIAAVIAAVITSG